MNFFRTNPAHASSARAQALFVLTSDLELEPSEPQLSCEVRSPPDLPRSSAARCRRTTPHLAADWRPIPRAGPQWPEPGPLTRTAGASSPRLAPLSSSQVRSFERMLEAVSRQSRAAGLKWPPTCLTTAPHRPPWTV